MSSKVITYQTPSGDRIDITPAQERKLTQRGVWPRNEAGQEYCQVHKGLHYGTRTPDEIIESLIR